MAGDDAGGGEGGWTVVGWFGVRWVEGGGVMDEIVVSGHMMAAAITAGSSIDEWMPSRLCFGER